MSWTTCRSDAIAVTDDVKHALILDVGQKAQALDRTADHLKTADGANRLRLHSTEGSCAMTKRSEVTHLKAAPELDGLDSGVDALFMAALVHSAPVAIYHADAAGCLTYANGRYRALFGLTSQQSLDDWAHALHPGDRARMQEAWATFCNCPCAAQFQWRSKSPTGTIRYLTESVVPMVGAGVEGFVGTITDVTELKEAQARVEKLQREIKHTSRYPSILDQELRQAIRLKQFELHYQPKVDLLTGSIHSAEALIRWRHPKRGLVPPAEFIPFAEQTGLIGEIGEWVVREACRQTKAWQDGRLPTIRVSVNLSATQFRHSDVAATIRQALEGANLHPRFLEVEITESVLMTDAESSVAILENLSQMGVLVSIDDFGTGYSSMSYLRRFPIDKLKIDRSFIREIASNPDDARIVRAIILLAHSLRLKVVAEGVETQEQLDFLEPLACDQYQGFFFSPALPPEEFAALLSRSRTAHGSFMNDVAGQTHSKLAIYRR